MDAKELSCALVRTILYSLHERTGDRDKVRERERVTEGGGERQRFKGNEGNASKGKERRGRTGNATENHGGRRGNYGSFLTCQRCA